MLLFCFAKAFAEAVAQPFYRNVVKQLRHFCRSNVILRHFTTLYDTFTTIHDIHDIFVVNDIYHDIYVIFHDKISWSSAVGL
jgi:hypothetical protein